MSKYISYCITTRKHLKHLKLAEKTHFQKVLYYFLCSWHHILIYPLLFTGTSSWHIFSPGTLSQLPILLGSVNQCLLILHLFFHSLVLAPHLICRTLLDLISPVLLTRGKLFPLVPNSLPMFSPVTLSLCLFSSHSAYMSFSAWLGPSLGHAGGHG